MYKVQYRGVSRTLHIVYNKLNNLTIKYNIKKIQFCKNITDF